MLVPHSLQLRNQLSVWPNPPCISESSLLLLKKKKTTKTKTKKHPSTLHPTLGQSHHTEDQVRRVGLRIYWESIPQFPSRVSRQDGEEQWPWLAELGGAPHSTGFLTHSEKPLGTSAPGPKGDSSRAQNGASPLGGAEGLGGTPGCPSCGWHVHKILGNSPGCKGKKQDLL